MAVPVNELSLRGKDDETIFKRCIKDRSAVVTFDRDFISYLDELYDHFGIILFTKMLLIGEMLGELQKVIDTFKEEEIRNTVIYLPWK